MVHATKCGALSQHGVVDVACCLDYQGTRVPCIRPLGSAFKHRYKFPCNAHPGTGQGPPRGHQRTRSSSTLSCGPPKAPKESEDGREDDEEDVSAEPHTILRNSSEQTCTTSACTMGRFRVLSGGWMGTLLSDRRQRCCPTSQRLFHRRLSTGTSSTARVIFRHPPAPTKGHASKDGYKGDAVFTQRRACMQHQLPHSGAARSGVVPDRC